MYGVGACKRRKKQRKGKEGKGESGLKVVNEWMSIEVCQLWALRLLNVNVTE